MNKTISRIKNKYFNESLDFRAQIFNLLGFIGCALGLFFGTFYIFVDTGIGSVLGNYATAAAAIMIIKIANRTRAFKVFFLITVVLVFFILFPILFFAAGGYNSGMPCFFVFAVIFTVLMLEGRRRTVFTILEFALYLGCFLAAYFYPETVVRFSTEADLAADIIIGCLLSSVTLAIAIYRHIVIYDQKQKELEKANAALQGFNRMKTELFSNISHEMKTPLTVVSVHIQMADQLFNRKRQEDEAQIGESLALAQEEIMRMSRLVNNSLRLASMQEADEENGAVVLPNVLNACVVAYTAMLAGKGNTLVNTTSDDLPPATGSADAVVQIVSNLLLNANAHTEGGTIRIRAAADGDMLTVAVEDDGEGIPKDLLAHVFERGVTDGSGSGFGLAICRQLVRLYGGEIEIESEPGKGTKVIFTLPVYREGNGNG